MNMAICGDDAQPCIVQFQHRKDEVLVGRTNARSRDVFEVGWNMGDHRRRLVGHSGNYVESGICYSGELAFWTEWEANTQARNLSPLTSWGCARRIHYVMSPLHGDAASAKEKRSDANDCSGRANKYQNTDPCVFGKSFKYSNCKQDSAHELKNLPAGSLIVFGSIHDNIYYLDTVFVVADGPGDFRTICNRDPGVAAVFHVIIVNAFYR